MLALHSLVLLGAALGVVSAADTTHAPLSAADTIRETQKLLTELNQLKSTFKKTMTGLARQTMLQQLFVEERVRSEGSSGVKQIRNTEGGTRPYHSATFTADTAGSIHEHADNDRTGGLGEMVVVLNGVEFKTRHNDYKLKMPSTKSKSYNEIEDIPFPDVPPSVLHKSTVPEQIAEMQEYFKAFHTQDTKHRDYRPYFKPVMCYIEGGWTSDAENFTEPFQSDRHSVDTNSWENLQDKIRFTAASGGKSFSENFAYLPTTIVNVTEDGEPVYAQWNYRVLCNPITTELSLKDFKPVNDIAVRIANNLTMSEYAMEKLARFSISVNDGFGYVSESQTGAFKDRRFLHGKMDDIMFEIPGKDNHPGYLEDNNFERLKHRVEFKNHTILNVARYHRHYRSFQSDASGLIIRNRGYSDTSMYVAGTQNPQIAKVNVKDCKNVNRKHVCTIYEGRYTYAIPIEVVWLTPLSKWNPYSLQLASEASIPAAHHRNGAFNANRAYNGTSSKYFYQTPAEFYTSGDLVRHSTDTSKTIVGVLDQHGQVRNVVGSGLRIFTPDIPGVGPVRLRYPVFPVHQDGNTVWKNLMALQDITLNSRAWHRMFETPPEMDIADLHYHMMRNTQHPPAGHIHHFNVTRAQTEVLQSGGNVTVVTSTDLGHNHTLVLIKDDQRNDNLRVQIVECDGGRKWCAHTHPAWGYMEP